MSDLTCAQRGQYILFSVVFIFPPQSGSVWLLTVISILFTITFSAERACLSIHDWRDFEGYQKEDKHGQLSI
jgi:hypothetical protein